MSESIPVSQACDPIFYSPQQPDKLNLGQEIDIKGKQKQEIIKILLDNGVSEECIREAIKNWWKRKDPAKYLSAVKHKLKLKESAQQLQNVADELKVEKEEETKEGKGEGEEKEEEVTPEQQIEEEKPLISIVTPELVGLAYGSVLEIVIAFLNIRYKKSVDPTDVFPDWENRMKMRGETIYKALEASGLLQERYIQMLILFISVGGGIGSDIVELARFYQRSEKQEEEKKEKLEGKNAVENSLQLQELTVKPKPKSDSLLEGVLG